MTRSWLRIALLLILVLTPTWARAADDPLGKAYAAILRGEYDAGRATVERLLEQDDSATARKVRGWLDSYHEAVASRELLKRESCEWNLAEARKALEAGNVPLALSFTAQAVPYASDPSQLASEPWVRELTQRCLSEAAALEGQQHWTKALNYYVLLGRVHDGDEKYEQLSEQATRYARIEVTYENDEKLQERIRDVDRELLQSAVKMVERLYYEEPDFKLMAGGALDNLITLSQVKKLQDYLDGLANPALRNYFTQRVKEYKDELERESEYTYKDLLRLFNRVNSLNRGSIEIPTGLLVVEFVEGMLSELDEYTGMIWPADAVDFQKMMMGGFEGVGIQLGIDERSNRLKVVTPLENSPALEAGVQPDDLIVEVDGESTAGWSTTDAVRNIMGPAGSKVMLTILRPRNGERIVVPLTRRQIELTTVRGVERKKGTDNEWDFMLDRDAGVAYIRLTGFHPESAQELKNALHEARRQGMQGLILDVRHNPGGLLDVAIEIVSAFQDRGDVVSTRGRLAFERREPVAGSAVYKDLPLVVLVNEGSASASEILAGALQDHHRAIVLGDRTFGKGSVQHVRPLSDEARLKLTTALYYLPSGRTPHKAPQSETWGVEPDWKLKLTPKEFRRVLEHERDTYIIHNEDASQRELTAEEREKLAASLKADETDEDDGPPFLSENDLKLLEADPNEAPETDPQLETALLLIRVKLAADVPWPRELAAAAKEQP